MYYLEQQLERVGKRDTHRENDRGKQQIKRNLNVCQIAQRQISLLEKNNKTLKIFKSLKCCQNKEQIKTKVNERE